MIAAGIITAVSSLGSLWLETRKTKAEGKIKIEQAKANAQATRLQRQADAETDYDIEALRQTQFSWKDEYILVVLTLPFIGSFIPVVQDYVVIGWDYLHKAPQEYYWAFLGAVGSSLGVRWVFSKFGKK